jgi:hypothetical protein
MTCFVSKCCCGCVVDEWNVCTCMYVCMYVCMCVCVCVCVYVQRLLIERIVEKAVGLCFLLGLQVLHHFVWLLLRATVTLSSQHSHYQFLSLVPDLQSLTLNCAPSIMKDVLKRSLLEETRIYLNTNGFCWNRKCETGFCWNRNCETQPIELQLFIIIAIGFYIFVSVRTGNLK